MTRYTNINSGARVEVRDDKVMDSSWIAEGVNADADAPEAKAAPKRSTTTKK